MKSRILGMGVAGACTLAICNAAYFAAAYAFTWCIVLQVPTGMLPTPFPLPPPLPLLFNKPLRALVPVMSKTREHLLLLEERGRFDSPGESTRMEARKAQPARPSASLRRRLRALVDVPTLCNE